MSHAYIPCIMHALIFRRPNGPTDARRLWGSLRPKPAGPAARSLCSAGRPLSHVTKSSKLQHDLFCYFDVYIYNIL